MDRPLDKNCDGKINFRIVLYQPEIPANTGNIGRLCLGTNSELHLIRPIKFFLNDKYLKRAGLDYWDKVKLFTHNNWAEFVGSDILCNNNNHTIYLCETHSGKIYTEPKYKQGDIFVFGSESKGLPSSLLSDDKYQKIYINMSKEIRSINLCNSVAIILYEAIRQIEVYL